MRRSNLVHLLVLSLAFSILQAGPFISESKAVACPTSTTSIDFLYGLSAEGLYDGPGGYQKGSAALIGLQVLNTPNRWGFSWEVTADSARNTVLAKSGRKTGGPMDGSSGHTRLAMDLRYPGMDYDRTVYFTYEIYDEVGSLIACSETLTVPGYPRADSFAGCYLYPTEGTGPFPSDYSSASYSLQMCGTASGGGLSEYSHIFLGTSNPYAPGGMFYTPPLIPSSIDVGTVGSNLDVDVTLTSPELISSVEYSTDNGESWKSAKLNIDSVTSSSMRGFVAGQIGSLTVNKSIRGSLVVASTSSSSALNSGSLYQVKVRARNAFSNGSFSADIAGAGSETKCIYFGNSSSSSCPTASTNTPQGNTAQTASNQVAPLKVSKKKKISIKNIAINEGLEVPKGSKVSIKIAKASKGICKVSGSKVMGIKAGACQISVTVTPKKTKQNKKPAKTSVSTTLLVT